VKEIPSGQGLRRLFACRHKSNNACTESLRQSFSGKMPTPALSGRVVFVEHLPGLPHCAPPAEVEVSNLPLVEPVNYARDINGAVQVPV
jgi:hypothetical protein